MIDKRRNVYLVGFSGTGKTTVGRILAEMLGRPFVDMDETIAERLSLSIPGVFARFGERRFRDEERLVVDDLTRRPGIVVATGGGVLLDATNVEKLRYSGILIALRATPEAIRARLAEVERRPLLDEEDPLPRIRELKAERRHLYDSVGVQILTDNLTPQQVADRIVRVLEATD